MGIHLSARCGDATHRRVVLDGPRKYGFDYVDKVTFARHRTQEAGNYGRQLIPNVHVPKSQNSFAELDLVGGRPKEHISWGRRAARLWFEDRRSDQVQAARQCEARRAAIRMVARYGRLRQDKTTLSDKHERTLPKISLSEIGKPSQGQIPEGSP